MIRVLSIMEAESVTGPAKNMLRFAINARSGVVADAGADLQFVTFYRGPTGSNPPDSGFARATREAGADLQFIRERSAWDPRSLFALRNHIERISPAVVQSHSTKAHLMMATIASRLDSKWIAFHHGYTNENLKVRLYNRLNRFSLPRADLVVTVCSPFAAALRHEGVPIERIRVLPNSIEQPSPVSTPGKEAARAQLGISSAAPVVVSIGRLSAEKGHRYLIDAVACLQVPKASQVLLLIVGAGPEESALRSLVVHRGVNAQFLGHRTDVSTIFAAADCFVLPSLSEGSPNVLLEAMAYSCPIVATNVGGVPDTVADSRDALLVAPADIGALSNAISRLLTDTKLARELRAAAHARVASFSPAEYRNRLLRIYEEVLTTRAVAAQR